MEREVQHDPQVLEGDDDVPRQPSGDRDPYVPEPGPGPGPGERRAFNVLRWAWIPLAVVIALVIWAIVV